jgi:hypothetical protein
MDTRQKTERNFFKAEFGVLISERTTNPLDVEYAALISTVRAFFFHFIPTFSRINPATKK